jgi:hypothetical protein
MEQAVLGVVEDLRLLALPDTLDGQAKLFAQLIVHVVVEIRDSQSAFAVSVVIQLISRYV